MKRLLAEHCGDHHRLTARILLKRMAVVIIEKRHLQLKYVKNSVAGLDVWGNAVYIIGHAMFSIWQNITF
ncbi:MAG: hypothetical protein SF097_00300 [Acidobacteriota bacterium]|nr:hypothetical protein [Acidobacteriota bacterium]